MESYAEVSNILDGELTKSSVKLRGWLHHKRSSGGIQFLILRDGTGVLQCTVKKDHVGEEPFRLLETAPLESVLEIEGRVEEDPRAPGGFELNASSFSLLNRAEEDYPIARKYHGPDFLLDYRHLWIRNEKMQAVLRVRSRFLEAAREWFKENDFLEFHVPTIVSAACEGGSTLFEISYFDQKAFLTQSWQLYAEAGIASLGKIYTIAPSFRAEKSRTRRHLTEYWHLEVEAPWTDLEGLLKIEEELLAYVLHSLAKTASRELKILNRETEWLESIQPPFPRITYDEAAKRLKAQGVELAWGEDLGYEQEKALTEGFNTPFFVTQYPKAAKGFYHKLDPARPEVTLSADLLAPSGYGEITGGGQRIDDLNELLSRIRDSRLNQKDYEWYLDLRRYGSVVHSGFGLGVERVIAWVCGLEHIRDAVAFPRLLNRVYP